MILIDGSIGWGQVLRTSIGLAALTLKDIKIINIRKNRPKPGLMAQHLAGIKVASEFCEAFTKGVFLGSMEVEFYPKRHKVENKKINIGTAGSIALLLQTLLPLLIFSKKEVTLEIIGGTSGLGAPTIEYLKYITFPLLSFLGIKLPEVQIIRQGFYPKGQGFVKIRTFPSEVLNSVELVDRGRLKRVRGVSVSCSLPKNTAHKQAYEAKKLLYEYGISDAEIFIMDSLPSSSPGTSITLWAEFEKSILGSDSFGTGRENIAKKAVEELIKSIESGAALDKYMADQIIPFLALSKGKSKVKIEEFTDHVNTNIKVTEEILKTKFYVDREEKIIEVEGIGFET